METRYSPFTDTNIEKAGKSRSKKKADSTHKCNLYANTYL